MATKLSVIFLIAMLAVLVFAIAKLAYFLIAFNKNTRHICHEMDFAKSYKEYHYWRKRLCCHYLTLIPFVTDKGVMSVYRLVFRKSDSESQEERKDSLVPLLLPSILGMFVCIICVCGMTWAWYTSNIQTTTNMKFANYDVTVKSIMLDEEEVAPIEDNKYELIADKIYTIELRASGTVTQGGYCLIENKDYNETHYTQTFKPGDIITIELTPENDGVFTFTGVWGSLRKGTDYIKEITDTEDSEKAKEASTKQKADKDTYTVKSGDTMSAIAEKFDTTVEKLAAYNNIDDPRTITSGQVLKIPPKDYEIPDSTTSSEPTANETKTQATTSAQTSNATKSQTTKVVTQPATEPVKDDSVSQSDIESDSFDNTVEEIEADAE